MLALKKDILDGRFGKPVYMKALHAMRRGDKYYARNGWAGRIEVKGCAVNDSPFNNACAHQFQVMTFLLGDQMERAAELAEVQAEPYKGKVDLVIDHHGSNDGFGKKNLIRPDAGGCAEVLYDVLTALGCRLTREIAECIYVGVSTDTGCFKFSSTKASTHITAAKLMEAGAHVEELNTLLFDTKSRERMEAERIARNHLEYHLDGRCALIYLTRDEIEQSRVDPADLEELTSLPISIEGVKVGLTLRQQPGGSYRISVRTAKGVDACAIARRLGGGGHTRAAGCELLGNLDNAKSAILSEVEAVLDAPQEEA